MDGNGLKVYRLTNDEVEKLLTAKFGEKLAAVNTVKLAKQNEKRARWLKKD